MDETVAVKNAVTWAGTQARLAELLGTTQPHVSAWVNRDGRISSDYALMVHRISKGKVSAHDLRPDLYPRGEVVIKKK